MQFKNAAITKLIFSFIPRLTPTLSMWPPRPHRCMQRFAVVFGVCWKRSTSKDKLSAKQSWQPDIIPRTAVTLVVSCTTFTPSALMHTRCQIWQRSKKAQIAPECVQAHTVHSHSWICRCDSCREGCPNTATSDSTSSESEHVMVCSNLPSGGSLLVCLRWQKVKRLEVSVICDEGNSRLRDVRSSLYKKAKWYHLQWFGIFDLPTHIHASPCIIMSLQPTSFCNSYWHTWVWQIMGIHVWVLSKITSRHFVPALLGFVRLSSPKWKLNKITNVKYLPREFAKWKIKE